MKCDKCNCVLEHDEEADIIRLNMPHICTECVEEIVKHEEPAKTEW